MKIIDIFATQRSIYEIIGSTLPIDAGVSMVESRYDGVDVVLFDKSEQQATGNRCAIIYYHGGGFAVGSAQIYRQITSRLAVRTHCLVVSVNYRLAPQHPFPGPIEDCLRATRHFVLSEARRKQGVDLRRIFLVGDSAGGQVVASVSQQLRRPDIASTLALSRDAFPLGSVLIYPSTQLVNINTKSFLEQANDAYLPRSKVIQFLLAFHVSDPHTDFEAFQSHQFSSVETRNAYAKRYRLPDLANVAPAHTGMEAASPNPEIEQRYRYIYEDPVSSPLFGDVSAFPASLVISCERDVLRDDSYMLVKLLKRAGRSAQHENFECSHGEFNVFHSLGSQRIMNATVEFIESRLATPAA